MSILLATANWDPVPWVERLARLAPGRAIFVHGVDAYDPADVRYALTWKPPEGLLTSLPNLAAIINLGAGVDALLSGPPLPENVPVVRLVDENLTARMSEWVTLQVLAHHRQALAYLDQQRKAVWRELPQPIAAKVRVGMMGYGVLGRDAAEVLVRLGYDVAAWSRTARPEAGPVEVYRGADGLDRFLARTDVLVCLLPLTPETRGILARPLFERLAADGALGGPVLINAGRGGLQVEADVVAALETGLLAGASLDVFVEEPLPADSPLWHAPNLILTPHVAAVSDPETVCAYAIAQIEAHESGRGLTNVVDPRKGY